MIISLDRDFSLSPTLFLFCQLNTAKDFIVMQGKISLAVG